MGWIETSGGYALSLDGTRVVCRNAAGRVLKQVPAKLKDDAEVVRLRQLAEWLERHERESREQVDAWLVRSLPVPVPVLVRVWRDPAWRTALRDLVVAPAAVDGAADTARAGFLRDADEEKGLGIVDLDGDSVWLDPAETGSVLIPHPVLLEDLEDLREFAAELEVSQSVEQLFREVWRRPVQPADAPGPGPAGAPAAGAAPPSRYEWRAYAGAKFAQLRHATSRATTLGYRVRGGQVVCRLTEGGKPLDAVFWLDGEYPDAEAWTGALEWRDTQGKRLPLDEVGPVALSEGVRMAALLHAGREVVSEEEASR